MLLRMCKGCRQAGEDAWRRPAPWQKQGQVCVRVCMCLCVLACVRACVFFCEAGVYVSKCL